MAGFIEVLIGVGAFIGIVFALSFLRVVFELLFTQPKVFFALIAVLIFGVVYAGLLLWGFVDVWSDWNSPSTKIAVLAVVVAWLFWYKLDKIERLLEKSNHQTANNEHIQGGLHELNDRLENIEHLLDERSENIEQRFPSGR